MRTTFGVALLALAFFVMQSAFIQAEPPGWAYAIVPGTPMPGAAPAAAPAPAANQPPADTSLKHIAGSNLEFTRAQIANRYGPADWFPGDHPQMPDVVAHGKSPDVWACSFCHYPNGKGRPENAGIAGFNPAYFIQTMNDFRNGNRHSAEPRKANTNVMIGIAKGMTEDEIKQAAEYFGSMKWTPWMKVVETDTVPKTRIQGGMYMALESGEKEPLGRRVIEMPENTEETEVLRNPRSGFIVYVPKGSIKKGEALVTAGGSGKTVACAVCHGADLMGSGPVPGIAGRSPSYLGRQMYDMQQGTRHGIWTELMKPVVSKLTEDDMINIVAYVSSLTPR